MPANGESVTISTVPTVPVDVSLPLLKRTMSDSGLPQPKKSRVMRGTLIVKDGKLQILETNKALQELGLVEHELRFTSTVVVNFPGALTSLAESVYGLLKSKVSEYGVERGTDGSVSVSDSVLVNVSGADEDADKEVLVSWSLQDEDLGSYFVQLLNTELVSR